MERVNERSTAYLTVTPKDKAGTAQVPTALTYRIDDVLTGTEILDDASVAPGSSVELTLTPEQNRMLGTGQAERRRVTVTATYGVADQVCAEYIYEVVGLTAVP